MSHSFTPAARDEFVAAIHWYVADGRAASAEFFEQDVAGLLAAFGIANKDRHNMGVTGDHRQSCGGENCLHARGAVLMTLALPAR